MTASVNIEKKQPPGKPVTTYYEKKFGNCLYKVTSVHTGEIDLGKALEDLTIRKIMALENAPRYAGSQT